MSALLRAGTAHRAAAAPTASVVLSAGRPERTERSQNADLLDPTVRLARIFDRSTDMFSPSYVTSEFAYDRWREASTEARRSRLVRAARAERRARRAEQSARRAASAARNAVQAARLAAEQLAL